MALGKAVKRDVYPQKPERVEMRQSNLFTIAWGLHVPFTIPPKHVPGKHFQQRPTEEIPIPMYAELQLKFACIFI